MYRRFIMPAVLAIFDSISRADIPEQAKRRHKRRSWNRSGGYAYKPNGSKECERRCRQIEAGSLRIENGLSP